MVLATAGAFALHDAPSGVHAAAVALMAGRVGLVFDGALYSGETLPALASDKEQLVGRAVAKQLAADFADAGQLLVAVEVFDVGHFHYPSMPFDCREKIGVAVFSLSMKTILPILGQM